MTRHNTYAINQRLLNKEFKFIRKAPPLCRREGTPRFPYTSRLAITF